MDDHEQKIFNEIVSGLSGELPTSEEAAKLERNTGYNRTRTALAATILVAALGALVVSVALPSTLTGVIAFCIALAATTMLQQQWASRKHHPGRNPPPHENPSPQPGHKQQRPHTRSLVQWAEKRWERRKNT